MRFLGRWIAISLLTLTVAVVLAFAALIAWARHVTAPTQGGITVGEYLSAFNQGCSAGKRRMGCGQASCWRTRTRCSVTAKNWSS